MTSINRTLSQGVDLLMVTFEPLAPIVGLAVLSALTSVALLWLMKAASDQGRIAAVKRSIRACLFEIRLFSHDLRAVFRAQGEILRHNLTYLRLVAVPLLWAVVPLILLTTQLHSYYGYGGLEPGRSSIVKVHLADDWQVESVDDPEGWTVGRPALALEAPPGIRVETPAVWIPSLNEAAWRIGAERPGDYELVVRVQGQSFTKSVHVSSRIARRSPVRVEKGFVNQLFSPAEPPLPDGSGLRSIEVIYPKRGIQVGSTEVPWMLVFVLLSTGFAVTLKGRFGVVL